MSKSWFIEPTLAGDIVEDAKLGFTIEELSEVYNTDECVIEEFLSKQDLDTEPEEFDDRTPLERAESITPR